MGVGGTQEEEVVIPSFGISKMEDGHWMPAVGESSKKSPSWHDAPHEAIVQVFGILTLSRIN